VALVLGTYLQSKGLVVLLASMCVLQQLAVYLLLLPPNMAWTNLNTAVRAASAAAAAASGAP
jgi:hypothetical protein